MTRDLSRLPPRAKLVVVVVVILVLDAIWIAVELEFDHGRLDLARMALLAFLGGLVVAVIIGVSLRVLLPANPRPRGKESRSISNVAIGGVIGAGLLASALVSHDWLVIALGAFAGGGVGYALSWPIRFIVHPAVVEEPRSKS